MFSLVVHPVRYYCGGMVEMLTHGFLGASVTLFAWQLLLLYKTLGRPPLRFLLLTGGLTAVLFVAVLLGHRPLVQAPLLRLVVFGVVGLSLWALRATANAIEATRGAYIEQGVALHDAQRTLHDARLCSCYAPESEEPDEDSSLGPN